MYYRYMSSTDYKHKHFELLEFINQDAYISHKLGSDYLTSAKKELPATILDMLKIFLNPINGLNFLLYKNELNALEIERMEHNNEFMENELRRRQLFFDDIEGRSLDEQQRRAVIADENNSLIIAGAGSGKTLTIVGKVKYLLSVLQVPADAILPISFTNKSAEAMKDRINVRGITPMTFHKFGLAVLKDVEKRSPQIYDGTNDKNIFKHYLKILSEDTEYISNLNAFFINYVKIPKSQFDFDSHGDYIQYMKDQNYTTFKKLKTLFKGKETYRNETVKSIEECVIANFLILNRVEYVYEAQYEYPFQKFGRKKTYKPDFTLVTPKGKVYLEHLGMDRYGNVPAFFAGPNESHDEASRRYQRMLIWKRKTHKQNGTKLLETYSYQFTNGSLLTSLKQQLIKAGIDMKPMTETEIWEVIQESGKDEVDALIDLSLTFLSLLKSNDHSVTYARQINAQSNHDKFLKERAALFLDLFEPLFNLYQDTLKENGEIDFNDMITRATHYIGAGDFHFSFDYVIIDEFQDLSYGRYRLLQAMRSQNSNVKFYCVGDDWQSIFRFAGSDIALFRDFDDHFGFTFKSKIETTYRFNEPLITTSSEFILKNPNQTSKSLRAPNDLPQSEYTVIESDGFDGDDTDAIITAINQMQEKGLSPRSEIYIIGRYNFDINRIQNRNKAFRINYSNGQIIYTFPTGKYKGKSLTLQFINAHKSKGLEADFVIVINCNSGKYGFPSGKADDPILNLLLSSADQFENGEERRLFYVAMTRTKYHVAFVTDRYRKSKFIKELQDENDERQTKCPLCGNGELIKRSGKGYLFYGCSNFAYGCSYSTSKAPIEEAAPVKSVTQHTSEKPQPVRGNIMTKSLVTNKSTTKLNSSQQNKLEYFCKSPQLYKSSDKARSKVDYLQSLAYKFNDDELSRFNKAIDIWRR
jgi:DNA helicase-4